VNYSGLKMQTFANWKMSPLLPLLPVLWLWKAILCAEKVTFGDIEKRNF